LALRHASWLFPSPMMRQAKSLSYKRVSAYAHWLAAECLGQLLHAGSVHFRRKVSKASLNAEV